jgi:hypothetical protein
MLNSETPGLTASKYKDVKSLVPWALLFCCSEVSGRPESVASSKESIEDSNENLTENWHIVLTSI